MSSAARDRSTLLAVVAVVVGPVIGFAVMLVTWSAVGTWGEGGIDYGVVLAGAVTSMLAVQLTGTIARQPLRAVAPWVLVTFFTVATAALLLIAAYIALMPDFGRLD